MTDTVSVETARKLKEAGLKWEPKEGDSVWINPMDCKGLILKAFVYGDWMLVWLCKSYNGKRWIHKRGLVWLPRLGDLQRELAKRTGGLVMGTFGKLKEVSGWHIGMATVDVPMQFAEQPEEAAAQALLAVLEGEGKGKE